jgi:hypothetical protein
VGARAQPAQAQWAACRVAGCAAVRRNACDSAASRTKQSLRRTTRKHQIHALSIGGWAVVAACSQSSARLPSTPVDHHPRTAWPSTLSGWQRPPQVRPHTPAGPAGQGPQQPTICPDSLAFPGLTGEPDAALQRKNCHCRKRAPPLRNPSGDLTNIAPLTHGNPRS